MFDDTMELLNRGGFRVVFVPHRIIEDYNATYNVMLDEKHIVTGAAKELKIPLNEIWISKRWKKYEKFIVFHELREILYRSEGFCRDEAHEKARTDESAL
jgi:competence protein ComEA